MSEKTFENGRYVPYRKWYEVTCESGYNKEGTEGRALIYCRRSTMTFRMNTNYRLTSCVGMYDKHSGEFRVGGGGGSGGYRHRETKLPLHRSKLLKYGYLTHKID